MAYCGKPARAGTHGMCGMHDMRLRRRDTTDEPLRRTRPQCSVDACARPHVAQGYCAPHYRRFVATGAPGAAEIRVVDKNSTRKIHPSSGYVHIKIPGHHRASNGWVREHLVVVEDKLGRRLVLGEEVHHINGVKSDNRPENLELWVVSQPKGQRPEDLVDWAREIIERYGNVGARG